MSTPRSYPSIVLAVWRWLQSGPWWRWAVAAGILLAFLGYHYFQTGITGVIFWFWALPIAALFDLVVTNPHRVSGGLAGVVAPIAAFGLAGAFAPEQVASTEFYKAAASILPGLLLAFVLDRRRDFHDATDLTQRVSLMGVIFLLVLAGYETLEVLASDDAALGDPHVVIGAMAGSTAALVISMITPSQAELSQSGGEGVD